MAAAEPHWRALERGSALATPYQHFDFLSLWQRHIGAPSGVEPFIVVNFDAAGRPVLLLPFSSRRLGALRAVEFLGGKHANFNFPLCRHDFAVGAATSDIKAMVARLAGRADVLLLAHQLVSWQGVANPPSLLPHQPSPSFGASGALAPDFDALMTARTSVYLQAFVVYGWLGGVSYVLTLVATFILGFRALLISTPWQIYLITAYAAFAGEVAEGFIIDTDHWRHFFLLLGLVWGLSAATINAARAKPLAVAPR